MCAHIYLYVGDYEHDPIKVDDFPEHVALMESRNDAQFKQEYNSITVEVPFTQHAAKLKVNTPKNRYKDIIPCKLINQLFIIVLLHMHNYFR